MEGKRTGGGEGLAELSLVESAVPGEHSGAHPGGSA